MYVVVICDSSGAIRLSQSNFDTAMKNRDFALDDVAKSTKQMITTLKSICATFDPIPANRFIAMRLNYNENTPSVCCRIFMPHHPELSSGTFQSYR